MLLSDSALSSSSLGHNHHRHQDHHEDDVEEAKTTSASSVSCVRQVVSNKRRPSLLRSDHAKRSIHFGATFRGFWINPHKAILEEYDYRRKYNDNTENDDGDDDDDDDDDEDDDDDDDDDEDDALLAFAIQDRNHKLFNNNNWNNNKDNDSSWCRWLDVDGSDVFGDDNNNENGNKWINKLKFGSFITNELTKPFVQWTSHVVSTRKRMLLKIRTLPARTTFSVSTLLDDDGKNNDNNHNHNHNDSDDTYYIQYLVAVVSKDLILTWNISDGGGGRKDNNNNNKKKCDNDHPSLSQQALTYLMPPPPQQQQQQKHENENEKDNNNNESEDDDYDSPIQDGTTSAALLAWLEFHVGRTLTTMMIVRSMGVKLVKLMDDDPSQVELTDIMDFKNNVSTVLAVAEEQSSCMNMIKKLHKDNNNNNNNNKSSDSSGGSGLDFTNLIGQLSILISMADSTERMGLRLEKRSISLRQQYDSYQQDLINHRLKVLTVISAIFMPLTFMAGWYGMNFSNMPELQYENSYYIFVTTIFAIASGLIFFFYSHGWFS